MADYFTNFSFIVPLPTAEAQKYALDLAQQAANAKSGDEMPDNIPAFIQQESEDWHFSTEAEHETGGWGLWLHSTNGGIDAVCTFIQHLLKKFAPEGKVTFEWSNDCTKPRLDAYGGGAAIITAEEIKSIHTAQWLHLNAA